MVDVEIGDRVTYYDGDGETERGLVLDDVEDAEYITVVTGGDAELGEGYNHEAESHSSVYPHSVLGDQYTATRHAFKPGWPDQEEGA